VIDELGFPKSSKIFLGNISEPATLKNLLEQLQGAEMEPSQSSDNKRKNRTVVVDAGIASEENLKFLKAEGYDYIVAARNKPVDPSVLNSDDMLTIKQDNSNKVEAQLIKTDGEHILYCKSFLKQQKEQSMKRSTEAEPFHRMIYDALHLSYYPLRGKRVEFKISVVPHKIFNILF